MMKLKRINTLLISTIVVAAFALGGCRTAQVMNVKDAAIESSASTSATDVANAIKRAGAGLGWVMKEEGPGHMVGTLFLRDHVAKVDITYNTKSFDITYKDSTNLNYDGTNIHSNYNGWVSNLHRAIQAQVSAI